MVLKYIRCIFVLLLFINTTVKGQKALQEETIIKVVFPANTIVGEEYTINIAINGSLAEGPGRLSIVLPEGFALQKDFESIGDVSAHNQFVNLVWGMFPKDQIFNDRFRIAVIKPTKGVHEIEWRFTFLSYGDFETLKFSNEINVATGVRDDNLFTNKNKGSIESTAGRTQNQTYSYKANKSRSINKAAGNIDYYIQISSSSSANKSAELKSKYNLQYPITIMKVSGLNKYNVGPFNNYPDALEYCRFINSKYDLGSFVVKYRGNERVK